MDAFVDAVRSAVAAGNSYAALVLAVALPDMCAAARDPKAGVGPRYKAWWTEYGQQQFTRQVCGMDHIFLGSSDAYALRCAVLHQGYDDTTGHKAAEVFRRYMFVQPQNESVAHLNASGDVLMLQVDLFCEGILRGVQRFRAAYRDDGDTQERLAEMLRIDDLQNGFRL